MANNENPTKVTPQTKEYLDPQSQALVTALTAAILSARRDVPPPDQLATAAAIEYGKIKGALRTHSEPIPTVNTSVASKG